MIEIVFSLSGNEYELSMNGHANYSNKGNDIVCAAASSLAYALLGFLENCPSVLELNSIEHSGEMEIDCIGDKKIVKTAFNMAVIGFLQLEKSYPEHISVDTNRYK